MVSFKELETVWVKVSPQPYPIYILEQLLHQELLFKQIDSNQIYVITDQNVAPLYLSSLLACLPDVSVNTYTVAPGEENKSITNWTAILQDMVDKRINRDAVVMALGGGMIGDLSGFSASSFKRGLSFIQIPTTLLSQVDASIGGKTAINFAGEKNIIGSFHQPKAVFIDPCMLKTLPQRDFLAGMAEVIKYALLGDYKFFVWLNENASKILKRDRTTLIVMIKQCCLQKARLVEEDEKEAGVRALLNLGHTFAHALESVTLYKRWLHGEAVAIGLYCQALLSFKLGYIDWLEAEKVKNIISLFALPFQIPEDIDIDTLIDFLFRDKKVVRSQLRFIVLESIGVAKVIAVNDLTLIRSVIEQNMS